MPRKSELQVKCRADVAREVAMTGDDDSGASMVSERQQGGVVHGGSFGGAEAACRFLEPELQIESWAGGSRSAVGAQQLCSPAGTGKKKNGGRTARAKKMMERVGDGGAGVAERAQEKSDRPWANVKAEFDEMEEYSWRVASIKDANSRRRWEARWKAREAREKAARARRLAAQDQGSKARPAQAGPCAACARQGGICGFCRERQRLAC